MEKNKNKSFVRVELQNSEGVVVVSTIDADVFKKMKRNEALKLRVTDKPITYSVDRKDKKKPTKKTA